MAIAPALTQRTVSVKSRSGAGTVVFDLPSGLAIGQKLIVFIANKDDRNGSALDAGSGGAWTTIKAVGAGSSTKSLVATYEVASGDGATLTVNFDGTVDAVCNAFVLGDVDLAASGASQNLQSSTFNMFGTDHNSGNTARKLWWDFHIANKAGSMVAQANTYDYTDGVAGEWLDDGVSVAGLAIYIAYRDDSAQIRYRTNAVAPYQAYHEMASNSSMIGLCGEFVAQDDANFPPAAPAVGGATVFGAQAKPGTLLIL